MRILRVRAEAARTVLHAVGAVEIVGGHNRYAAALSLKWKSVVCNIVSFDDLHAQLAEIDENLVRANLTSARELTAIRNRKAI